MVCDFFFDRPNAVYHSGDTINGKIVLTTSEVKRVRGIHIIIKGEAKVEWSEKKRHGNAENDAEQSTIHYRGDKQYLHSRVQVEEETDYPPGVHEYTFSTPLPPLIPSSVSGPHGHVAYELELKLERPSQPDIVYTHPITVIRHLLMHFDPSYMQPIIVRSEKSITNVCCFPSFPARVKSDLRTEFSIYAPGDFIGFVLSIDNESDKDLDECHVQLIQNIGFKSQTPEIKINNVTNVIKDVSVEGVSRFTSKQQKGSIRVPQLPPTTTLLSDIITVSYILKATAGTETGTFAKCFKDLRINVGIGRLPPLTATSGTNPNNVVIVQPPVQYYTVWPLAYADTTEADIIAENLETNKDPSAPDDEEKRLIPESVPLVVPSAPLPIGEQSSLLDATTPGTSASCYAKGS